MEPDIGHIKNLFKKRISLLRELLDCVERERDSLINQDINGIWDRMEEKNNILGSLEKTKNHLEKAHANKQSLNIFSPTERHAVAELTRTQSNLKEEIKSRIRENISFINDTMDFFHELVTVMTMSNRAEGSYGPSKQSRKESLNLLYHSEV